MVEQISRANIGLAAYFGLLIVLSAYFGITALQGEYGLYRRIQLESHIEDLERELESVSVELEAMENKTRRLSNEFLDLDLLDERARKVLGYIRPDEFVVD